MANKYKPKSEHTPESWARYLAYQREYTERRPDVRSKSIFKWREKNRARYLENLRNKQREKYWAAKGLPVPAEKVKPGRPRAPIEPQLDKTSDIE